MRRQIVSQLKVVIEPVSGRVRICLGKLDFLDGVFFQIGYRQEFFKGSEDRLFVEFAFAKLL